MNKSKQRTAAARISAEESVKRAYAALHSTLDDDNASRAIIVTEKAMQDIAILFQCRKIER